MNESLGKKLRDYIIKRAATEGVGFDLTVEFFEDAIRLRANPIFGVHHNGKILLKDDQEPTPGFFLANTGGGDQ